MTSLLNPDKRYCVTIILRMFEASLRQAEIVLKKTETSGIFHQQSWCSRQNGASWRSC